MSNEGVNLRVCFLLESYYPVVGGTEAAARSLAEDLGNGGAKVIVVTRRTEDALRKQEKIGKISVHRIGPRGVARLQRWRMVFTCLPVLLKSRQEYDVLFVQGFRALGISAVLMSRILRKTCILKADSNGEMSGDFFLGRLEKLKFNISSLGVKKIVFLRNAILRRADAFVSISSEITKELIDHGVSPDKIRFVPNSVDVSQFCPVSDREKIELRRKLGLPQGKKIVVFTGRLVSYKGLPLLMRVWKEISEEHPDTMLLLVGSGGSDIHNCEAELKGYVASNHLEKRVGFTGDVRNVQEFLQASDIFVFPTENEAFGIALIEAMACGLPVISTREGGIKDILTDQKDGIVVEPGSHRQLRDAIHALASDTALADSLGKAGLQSVRDRYSREIIAKKYFEVLSSV